MTKPGGEMKRLMPEGMLQKTFSLTWLDHWRDGNGDADQLSLETVESRLSECLNDKSKSSTRFFLEAEARWRATAAALGCTAAEAMRLRALAGYGPEATLSGSVFVDLTRLGSVGNIDTILGRVAKIVPASGADVTVTWLLTKPQLDAIPPRALQGVTVERVESSAAASTRLAEVAGMGALAISEMPVSPLERWAALETRPNLAIAPPGAVAIYLEAGVLPAPTAAGRPLAKLLPDGEQALPASRPLPGDAALRRRLVMDLVAGESGSVRDWLDPDAPAGQPISVAQRLAWATELGVEASASRGEWLEAFGRWLAPIPLVTDADRDRLASFDDHVSQAYARSTADGIEAVNPPVEETARLEALGVRIYRSPRVRGADLRAFLAAAAARTLAAHLADPHLEALLAQHADDQVSRGVLERARASLLFSDVLQPVPAPTAADAVARARDLLEAYDVWPVAFQMTAAAASGRGAPDPVPPVLRPFLHVGDRPSDAVMPSACRAVYLERDGALWHVRPADTRGERDEAAGIRVPARSLDVDLIIGPLETWADQMLGSVTLVQSVNRHRDRNPYSRQERMVETVSWEPAARPPVVPELEITEATPAHGLWSWAEESAAFALHALRAALRFDDVVRLPDGGIVVPIATGLFARLSVTEEPEAKDMPAKAVFFRTCREGGAMVPSGSTFRLATASSYGWPETQIDAELPEPMHVVGHGLRISLSFRPSLLAELRGGRVSGRVMAGTVDRMGRHREEDRRRREDD